MSDLSRRLPLSRRRFLQSSTAVGAGLVAGAAMGGPQAAGANDRLSIGMIGVGERGTHHLN